MTTTNMMKFLFAGTVFAATGYGIQSAKAGELQGYQCMSLTLTQQQMMDPSLRVPIKSGPSASASVTGNAIATVIATSPLVENHGYIKVLQLNGHTGWIQAGYLKPWANPGSNGQRCYPATLPNGRIGFDYR